MSTEAVGASILDDLAAQRDTIARTRATLDAANSGLARGTKLLKGMGRRAFANRVLMVVIILFLFLLICAVIWLNWFYDPHAAKSPPPPPPPPSS